LGRALFHVKQDAKAPKDRLPVDVGKGGERNTFAETGDVGKGDIAKRKVPRVGVGNGDVRNADVRNAELATVEMGRAVPRACSIVAIRCATPVSPTLERRMVLVGLSSSDRS
jgi:hypothetical protein